MAKPSTNLRNQTTMFEEIVWSGGSPATASIPSGVQTVSTPPPGLTTGMLLDPQIPYWVFNYQISSADGLVFTDINVKDTLSSGSTEPVFERLEYDDLLVEFTDGTIVNFDIGRALSNPSTTFEFREEGQRTISGLPPDSLFQRGLLLTLHDDVLASSSGSCNVVVELSCVFRGPYNDFDPGGIPAALDLWPQISFRWDNSGATKRVSRFRGSVKYTTNHKMPMPMAPNANVASFYTDSNSSISDSNFNISFTTATDRATYYAGAIADFAALLGLPNGWSMVFDYLKMDIQEETEINAVYGPNDGAKYTASTPRDETYEWVPGILSPGIHVRKADRQGMYDNIHIHAKMMAPDSRGNNQVHGPFCGHSCIHSHWRWSSISVDGSQSGPGWRYKGWSKGPTSRAYATIDAPLIPPNQKLTVALCQPGSTRFSPTNIINPSSPGPLDPLNKLVWYCYDILEPNAGDKQVIFEQGIGWAYRYAMIGGSISSPIIESTALLLMITSNTPTALSPFPPSKARINQFFEDDVYPGFRYIDNFLHSTNNIDQIPQGTHNTLQSGGTGTSMEDL